jgi:hypothetical protein
MTGELLRAALELAGRGRPVHPCKPAGKDPLTRHGVHEATTDPAIIRRWWQRWPNANPGLATGQASGLLVLDVDAHHAGMATLARLCAHGDGLATLEVETGSGGVHLYLALPAGIDLGNSNRGIKTGFGPGVDVRGSGGYVVAPPSVHPSGGRYRWGSGQLLPVPGWLVQVLTQPEPRPAPPRATPQPGRRRSAAGPVRRAGRPGRRRLRRDPQRPPLLGRLQARRTHGRGCTPGLVGCPGPRGRRRWTR